MSVETPVTLPKSVNETVVITVIVINSIAIFLRAFPDLDPTLSSSLLFVDYACTLYFVYEVSLKLKVCGRGGFFANDWNKFDFAVVVVSMPMLLAPWLDVGHDLSVVLLLRLARLLRFFRLMRFIPEVDRVFAGIRRGLQASVGVFLALALYNFALGLAACYLFRGAAPEHFGDPLLSLYSMFKVFTVEGWFEIPDAVAVTHPGLAVWVRLFFMFSVATGGLLGLSMANAVFVDEMVMDNNRELEEQVGALREQVSQMQLHQQAMLALLRPPSSEPDAPRVVESTVPSADRSEDAQGDAASPEPTGDS